MMGGKLVCLLSASQFGSSSYSGEQPVTTMNGATVLRIVLGAPKHQNNNKSYFQYLTMTNSHYKGQLKPIKNIKPRERLLSFIRVLWNFYYPLKTCSKVPRAF